MTSIKSIPILLSSVLSMACLQTVPPGAQAIGQENRQSNERETDTEAQAEPQGNTQEMVELLARISAEVNGENWRNGAASKEVQNFRNLLGVAKKPAIKAGLRKQLGLAYLRDGNVPKALEQFNQIAKFLEGIHAPPYAKRELADAYATGFLRKAENDNCLALHGPDSCLMPLKGGGVHRDKTATMQAKAQILEFLELEPDNRGLQWLLNLVHMALGSYPSGVSPEYLIPETIFSNDTEAPRFTNVATELGIDSLGMAGGVVMDDLDNDGYVDLVASAWGLHEQLIYYHNDGDGSFSDWTDRAGLTGICGGLNMSHADFDNDGDLDILVLRGAWKTFEKGHPNSLLRNKGDGTFVDCTIGAGLFSRHPTQVGQWADYDNDGWLDIFIGNESTGDSKHPCELYRNNQNGTFTNVASLVGLDVLGFVKGAAWGDFDNDGDPDLYVSRLHQPNLLFRNERDGDKITFTEIGESLGLTRPYRSFPTWFFDYNNDGLLDLFVAPFPGFDGDSLEGIVKDYLGEAHELPTARLYKGLPGAKFADVSKQVGLDDAMLAMGANFGDLNNDGFLDVYIGTGEPKLHTLVPNRMYQNMAGKSFSNITFAAGFGHLQKGHGIAFGDLDNDGDQDIYAVMGGAFVGDTAYNALFENPGNGNKWIQLELRGVKSNRSAIGAQVRIQLETTKGTVTIFRTVGTGGSFGASTLNQEIGLGAAKAISSLQVRWPGSLEYEDIQGAKMNAAHLVIEGSGRATSATRPPVKLRK